MQSIEGIIKKIKKIKPELYAKYHVRQLGLFGSYVRNGQKEKSDLDILVEFDPNSKLGLLKFIEMENYLSDYTGIKVDLIMKDGLKSRIGKRILDEVIYL